MITNQTIDGVSRELLDRLIDAYACHDNNPHCHLGSDQEAIDELRALLAAPACAHAWTDDGMFTLLCTKCGETEQDLNSPEDEPAAPVAGEEWRMNPCKQGHRDVGAAGGVASCYQCGEKITARTTEEAFALWNSSHPKACCGSCPAGCTVGAKP